VTTVAARADPGSLWLVRGFPGGPPCPAGTPVRAGQPIRLQHAASGRWLHTHGFPSPLTRNQEVSAFGGPALSDALDAWTVELERGTPAWTRGAPVRLRHAETGVFLASPDRAYGHPIAGQYEVCGRKGSDAWSAEEGVFLHERVGASKK
jgi:dolichyl-phosphate-mannose--protein O-mannosyl transferase